MTELKRATVKCYGKFKTSLSINRNGVSISFTAERKTVDLNRLAAMLKDGATAIFVSDQTELPVDDDKDKPVKGQMSLLDNGNK